MKNSKRNITGITLMIVLAAFATTAANAQLRFSGTAEVTYMVMADGKVIHSEQLEDTEISVKKGYVKVGDKHNKVLAISKPTPAAPGPNYFIYYVEKNTSPDALNEFDVKSYIYNSDDRTLYIAWNLDDNRHAWLAYKLKEKN
jgi:hypothetical protein